MSITSVTKAQLIEALADFPDDTEIVLDLSDADRSKIYVEGQGDEHRWYELRIDDKMDGSDEKVTSAMCWLSVHECIMRGANDAEMSEVLPWLLEHADDDEPTVRERPEPPLEEPK